MNNKVDCSQNISISLKLNALRLSLNVTYQSWVAKLREDVLIWVLTSIRMKAISQWDRLRQLKFTGIAHAQCGKKPGDYAPVQHYPHLTNLLTILKTLSEIVKPLVNYLYTDIQELALVVVYRDGTQSG